MHHGVESANARGRPAPVEVHFLSKKKKVDLALIHDCSAAQIN